LNKKGKSGRVEAGTKIEAKRELEGKLPFFLRFFGFFCVYFVLSVFENKKTMAQ
jgi:hypothetical protein